MSLLTLCACSSETEPGVGHTGAPGSGPADSTTSTPGPQPAWFVEEAAERGLEFHHDSGARRTKEFYMPEIIVGGAALFDMDGDGDLDAYLVQSGSLLADEADRPPNQLFRNRGDGTFEDVTEGSGADDRGIGSGVVTGDYDNDGDVDLYVTNLGANRLLRNDGGGRFTDVTSVAGVGAERWSTSGAFLDYDRDGDLDLIVVNYLEWSVETRRECFNNTSGQDYCSPQTIDRPTLDVLYRNEGDGTFVDVTASAGLGGTLGTGMGVVCGDFDGDGWVDIFVANDGWEDRLWMNEGDGTFDNRALRLGCAVDNNGAKKAGMGVTVADIDDDGDLDLLVCNLAGETDSLYRNDGSHFVDITAAGRIAAVSRWKTRFGMAWQDFDCDGRLDLYQANGRVAFSRSGPAHDPYAESNTLFRGVEGLRFVEVSPAGGTIAPLVATSRAAAFGDIDADGGVDILVVNRDESVHLLHNVAPNRGHWLRVRLVDSHGRDSYHARAQLQFGGRSIVRECRTAYSYQAANDPWLHFGLGAVTEIGALQVHWPDGQSEVFDGLRVDRNEVLTQGTGRSSAERDSASDR